MELINKIKGKVSWNMGPKINAPAGSSRRYKVNTVVVDCGDLRFPFTLFGKSAMEHNYPEGTEVEVEFTNECNQRGGKFYPFYKMTKMNKVEDKPSQ